MQGDSESGAKLAINQDSFCLKNTVHAYMYVGVYMVNEYWIMIHVDFCSGTYKDLFHRNLLVIIK